MTAPTRVLVVDDDRQVGRTIERILARSGYSVTTATNGAQALAEVERSPFDVAVVDFQLPDTNGVAVLSKISDRAPRCKGILASGHLSLQSAVEAVNTGRAAQIIEKPFDTRQLLDAVACVLDASWAPARHREQCADALAGLSMAVQPIFEAEDQTLVAFEALIRPDHPELTHPGLLLEAVERCRMVEELGDRVAELATGLLPRLPSEALLFLNLHPDELRDTEGLCKRLMPLVPQASRVVLEITERTDVQGSSSAHATVEALASAGFRIAVDDLGAGYSTLSALAELNPHFIKVDMSIVRNLDTQPRKRRLIELLVRFAEATEARLIAEGVETPGELEALRGCGVELLQGFLLGRPDTCYLR